MYGGGGDSYEFPDSMLFSERQVAIIDAKRENQELSFYDGHQGTRKAAGWGGYRSTLLNQFIDKTTTKSGSTFLIQTSVGFPDLLSGHKSIGEIVQDLNKESIGDIYEVASKNGS